MGSFNDPAVVPQSWYVLGLSRELARGKAMTRLLLDRKVALWRGEDGRVRALDARCPHLGADLGRGRVEGNAVRCAFHHWKFAGDGRCVEAPALARMPEARAFSYPVEERYGALWVFNGPAPLFPVPWFQGFEEGGLEAAALKPQTLACHPHVAAMNGLDVQHFSTVHRFAFAEEPVLELPDPYRVSLKLKVRLEDEDWGQRALRFLVGPLLDAEFTTWGGNLATIDGRAGRFPVRVLFTHCPLPGGRSLSRTFFLAPRGAAGRLALAVGRLVMGYILAGDREIFDGLDFRPNPSAADRPLAAFLRQADRLPVFHPERTEPEPSEAHAP